MRSSSRLPGIIGMAASPFFCLQSYFLEINSMKDSSLSGLCGLIHMIGWSCSIIGLLQMKATGEKFIGKAILCSQLLLLTIANASNTWIIIDPANNSALFNILDFFWPISYLFMIVTGVAVITAKKLHGFSRIIPVLTGLWLPVAMGIIILFGENTATNYLMNLYSLISFLLLGALIYRGKEESYAHYW